MRNAIPSAPSWFPQYGVLSSIYLPEMDLLPEGEWETIPLTFRSVEGYLTVKASHAFAEPFALLGMTAVDTDAAGFQAQLYHQIPNAERTLFAKHVLGASGFGTASRPKWLKRPLLVDAGEQLLAEVRNLSANTVAEIEICLHGVRVRPDAIDMHRITLQDSAEPSPLGDAGSPGGNALQGQRALRRGVMRHGLRPNFWDAPQGAISFDQTTPNAVAMPAAGSGPVTVLSYTVPAGWEGAVRWMSVVQIGGQFLDASGNVVWRVLQNGAAIPGLENLTSQKGTLQQPTDTYIRIHENDILTVTVEVPAGASSPPQANVTTAALLKGWLIPLGAVR